MSIFAQTGGTGIFIYLVLFGAIIYFLMIRPQRKRTRQQREMLERLEVGDQVRTIGGLLGMVVGMTDDAVVLAMEEGRIRVLRSAIATRVRPEGSTDLDTTDGN